MGINHFGRSHWSHLIILCNGTKLLLIQWLFDPMHWWKFTWEFWGWRAFQRFSLCASNGLRTEGSAQKHGWRETEQKEIDSNPIHIPAALWSYSASPTSFFLTTFQYLTWNITQRKVSVIVWIFGILMSSS